MINFEIKHPLVRKYQIFLKLEKSLSPKTVEAYLFDLSKLLEFAGGLDAVIAYSMEHLETFFIQLRETGIGARTQARILSSVRSFYRFLIMEDVLSLDPSELLESPRIGRHLPEVLNLDEIDRIISAIDLTSKEGQRNKAMLETLYSCGLRVSELICLKLSNCFFDEEYILVEGKGNKQRYVPISNKAIHEIECWMEDRAALDVKKGNENFVFLNRRGAGLTRSMIFKIIRNLAALAEVKKTISPHTFRHSFATHLLEGGANLRVIQQMLGHESIQTTEIYTHMDRTYLREQILQFHPHNQ